MRKWFDRSVTASASASHFGMNPADVRAMRARLAPFAFDNVFGCTWGRNIIGGGRAAVDASFERYFNAIGVDGATYAFARAS